ncbi:uncharacterized protein LOC122632445 isoform X1 [Vespula pensylvanica]|uniref:Uncharacterized protein n=2 Tax=Vespula pensylvanica TaxID=30213 RepID=A0A834PE61_VESPE|nr:uncharacterized protein LOC122632445 isoform X1 [Vespula pensylvanica]KAF7438067.1 hypothetical protein H0235_000458 [Vespula pensylvanica]
MSVKISGNKISDRMKDEEIYDSRRLRETAKIASIYHKSDNKFQRNKKLSHIVHASLNFMQFLLILAIKIFHHVHYNKYRRRHETNENMPILPEEMNIIFALHSICIMISLIFAVLWLKKTFLSERPLIVLIGCMFGAISMLSVGIMEMKQVEQYIDLTKITDEQLLNHPLFVHNFSMCILSIIVMTLYLLQAWILLDVWLWIRKFGRLPDSVSKCSSNLSMNNEVIGDNISAPSTTECPGKLDPIPELRKFFSKLPTNVTPIEDEPVIFYCCCVDCYNYIKESRKRKPHHEFQMIHVL